MKATNAIAWQAHLLDYFYTRLVNRRGASDTSMPAKKTRTDKNINAMQKLLERSKRRTLLDVKTTASF